MHFHFFLLLSNSTTRSLQIFNIRKKDKNLAHTEAVRGVSVDVSLRNVQMAASACGVNFRFVTHQLNAYEDSDGSLIADMVCVWAAIGKNRPTSGCL